MQKIFALLSVIFVATACGHKKNYELLGSSNLELGDSCIITGFVAQKESKTLSSGASVYIKDSRIGIATDTLGRFLIKTLPGKYRIVASYVGFENIYTPEITFKSNEATAIVFYLEPAQMLYSKTLHDGVTFIRRPKKNE